MTETQWKIEVLVPGDWRGATSCLLSHNSHHMLVDTGSAHEDTFLVAALERKGLHPADISTVISTHFHIDHVMNNSLFSRSRIYATQESYDWACSLYSDLLDESQWESLVLKYYPEALEYERARGNMAKLRKLGLRWWDRKRLGAQGQYRWLETHALPEGLQIARTSGHVPGHISVIVDQANPPTVIAGDALLTSNHDDRVLTMIAQNRAQAQRDRALILSRPGLIIPGHDQPFVNGPSPRANPSRSTPLPRGETSTPRSK
jgi:glyoxylase-like metal-dependent hydrolase (beta-lactamase superfamily II)